LFENHLHIVWKDNAPENVYTASGLRKGEVRILSIQQKILLESAAGLKDGVAAASRPEDVQTPVTIRDGVLIAGNETAPGGHGAAFAWWERHFRRPGRTYLIGLSDALPRLKVASPQATVKVLPTLWVFDISPASAGN
jgi:hypothetical protein